jgi:putative toxin-antitoxin system antitoxin component (TIGR02293 family)
MTQPQRAASLSHIPHRSPYLARLSVLLKLARPLRSEKELANIVEACVAPEALDCLGQAGLTAKELALVLPPRTLSHRRAQGAKLTVGESDRTVRLARVLALAEAVFGSNELALLWLRKPLRRFEGRTALEMLATETGGRLIEEQLIQIDEGYSA